MSWTGIPPSLSVSVTPHSFGVLVYGNLARMHYSRVIADGGVIDSYQDLQNAVISLQRIYGSKTLTADLAAAIDPAIFGYQYRTDGNGTWCVKAYSLMGASSDVAQATPAAQPRLFRYLGQKYFWNPANENNNYLSTPNTAGNNIIGDIDIDAGLNFTTGGRIYLCDRRNATQQFTFSVRATNVLDFTFYNGAIAESAVSTASVVSASIFFRVKRIASTGDVTFYSSSDGVTWTQLGAIVPTTAGNLVTQVSDIRIGSTGSGVGTGNLNCYSMRLYDGDRDAGGTLINNFIADDYDVAVSQNTLTSSTTGEVWTRVRSTATTGFKSSIIDRTQIQGNATTSVLNNATFAQAQPNTTYMVASEFTWTASSLLVNGGSAIPLYQRTGSPNMSASAGTDIDYASEELNRIKAYMCQFNGANSLVGTNGVYTAPAAGGAGDYDRLDILGGNGVNFANGQVNTLIIAKQDDDLATRNLINTLVRSWSGNPA